MKSIVIGGGPAGLMAAEVLSAAGAQVDVYDAMPSLGRKFLMAGKGGLNITHSEPWEAFVARYGARHAVMEKYLTRFTPADLRAWVHALGVETFVGTSGRVFPKEMKAAPLLRAWLRRLRAAGVQVHVRHRWVGWDANAPTHLTFDAPNGPVHAQADVVVLALGGASWPQLGSDGAWAPLMTARGIPMAPFQASNCGFDVNWSDFLRTRYAGHPIKPVVASVTVPGQAPLQRQGEFVLTEHGLEGGLIYALSAPLRDTLAATGSATLQLDLAPGRPLAQLIEVLKKPRGRLSLPNFLRKYAGLDGVKVALLHEAFTPEALNTPDRLAQAIKAVPIPLARPRPMAEAISTAGGVPFDALTKTLMLNAAPGVFCTGEMLDWDAPTGGSLMTACMARGKAAGEGAVARLKQN